MYFNAIQLAYAINTMIISITIELNGIILQYGNHPEACVVYPESNASNAQNEYQHVDFNDLKRKNLAINIKIDCTQFIWLTN